MKADRMQRVSRAKPCPVCGKPDWCLLVSDGSAAICQRVEEGSVKRCGDAGWLHILRDDRPMRRPRPFTTRLSVRPDSHQDFDRLAGVYEQQLTAGKIADLSRSLGVSADSLRRLHTGWDGAAYTLPMSDAEGRVIGIRRRFLNGFKCSLRGSRSGLFIPSGLNSGRRLLVTEGPTDAAAALDLDLDAIGRPSCRGAGEMITQAAKGRTEIVIVGDNDDVGRGGAMELAGALALYYRVKVIYPPADIKDLRVWLGRGLTARELESTIENASAVVLAVR